MDEIAVNGGASEKEDGIAMGIENESVPQNGFLNRTENGAENGYGTKMSHPKGVRTVDLRSDTFTQPTKAMREAMANAAVGDDVVGEDPTANELQESAANLFGKEAALFVPSGTMGNLIAVLTHCEVRGSEVILGHESHIVNYEQGGISTLGGVHPKVLKNQPDGTIDLDAIEKAIKPNDVHFATTRLICLENTHNRCGGRVLTAEYTDDVGLIAERHGIKLHVDGARIFNASTALGVKVKRLVQSADSISVCLSKGLGAPVGSVLVGSHEFITKARRWRKALGGGMRQVGVLCAAGLIALHDMPKRLKEDHDIATALAEGLKDIGALYVDDTAVDSNIVFIGVANNSPITAEQICEGLGKMGVLAWPFENTSIRLVTNYHVTQADVEFVVSSFKKLMLREVI